MSNVSWIIKHKPEKLNKILLNIKQKKIIYSFIQSRTFSNIIISGNTGIGKTTIVNYLMKKLFGNEMKNNTIEIYSSDSRKINDLKNELFNFCTKPVVIPTNEKKPDKYPKFKIIFFDEVDNITKKTQQLILDILNNKNIDNIFFAFTCNESNKINDSIQSKCQTINICSPTHKELTSYLVSICKIENVKYELTALELISLISNGDIRQSIIILESIVLEGDVTNELLTKIKGIPCITTIEELLFYCNEKKINEAINVASKMLMSGYCIYDIVFLVVNILKIGTLNIEKIDMKVKIMFIDKLCRLLNIVTKGYKNNIQLYGTIAELCE